MPSRQESIVSELGEGHTHPEAMRQLGGMVRTKPPFPAATESNSISRRVLSGNQIRRHKILDHCIDHPQPSRAHLQRGVVPNNHNRDPNTPNIRKAFLTPSTDKATLTNPEFLIVTVELRTRLKIG